nr:hypothetical protein [uncultured Pedobacter sp.]
MIWKIIAGLIFSITLLKTVKKMKLYIGLLALIFISLSSCTKNSTFSNPEIAISKEGILRIECENCDVNYHINNKDFNVSVSDGSNDIPFYYTSDFKLKTEVVSKADQNIRVLVIDSFGRIVSNELSTREKGEISKMEFAIKIK